MYCQRNGKATATSMIWLKQKKIWFFKIKGQYLIKQWMKCQPLLRSYCPPVIIQAFNLQPQGCLVWSQFFCIDQRVHWNPQSDCLVKHQAAIYIYYFLFSNPKLDEREEKRRRKREELERMRKSKREKEKAAAERFNMG